MNLRKNEAGVAHLAVIGIIAGVFVIGAGTAVASNSSKPGDALYSIDRGMEGLRLAVAFSGGMKEAAHLSMAEERVTEVKALLAEKDVDAAGIATALENFEAHKAKVASLLKDSDSDHAKDIDDEFEAHEDELDKLFESRQASLESEREQLKKQYEAAVKAGNTTLAANLKAQIDSFETTLKDLEDEREAEKQKLEEHEKDIEEHQDEATKQREEQEREDEKQRAEQEHEDESDEQEEEDAPGEQ